MMNKLFKRAVPPALCALALTTAVNSLAVAVASRLNDQELGLVGAILTQLGIPWRPLRPSGNFAPAELGFQQPPGHATFPRSRSRSFRTACSWACLSPAWAGGPGRSWPGDAPPSASPGP